jgi:hypothetical protein
MTTFLLDLWQDLRAKRLWPIAVALVAATVAVPMLLFKPASSTPPSSSAGQVASGAKLPIVTLDASSVDSSHLDVFGTKNPFAGTAEKPSTGTTSASASAGAGGSTVGSSLATAASAASGGTPTTGGGDSGGTKPPVGPDGKPVTPGVHWFTYTADVRFGLRSDVKTYKGLEQLDLLPDGQTPVLAFMGVKDGKTAVFFITDPAFRADGEGDCQPSASNCAFISLRLDESQNEETLSAQNGQIEYTLKLTGLHIKNLSEKKVTGDTTSGKSASKAAKARAKKRATLLSLPAAGLKR